MRLGRKLGWAAATGVAAAMVAAPLPALAEEAGDAATGDLIVTRFDDRYADGLFDPSKTAPSGDVDRLNTSHAAQLIDVNGKRWYVSADADGLYRFNDVPVGPATLYLGYPNNPPGEALFDATGAGSAADIERLPTTDYFGPQGTVELVIDEDGEERLIGMTALRLVANVQFADGTPVGNLGTVELGSGEDWYPATEYSFRTGTYEAFEGYGYVRHLPGDLGVRFTVPEGYRVASATAADNREFPVTERDGAFWFDSAEVWNYFWNPAFTITLEEAPDTVEPGADTKAPRVTVHKGVPFTAGDGEAYDRISFKLHDIGGIDKVSINGTETDLSNKKRSGINFIEPGKFGAVSGENTLIAYDVAGNTGTITFTLN